VLVVLLHAIGYSIHGQTLLTVWTYSSRAGYEAVVRVRERTRSVLMFWWHAGLCLSQAYCC
jgi:hypothetical protein